MIAATISLALVVASWLAIRWHEEDRAFRQILCAPIPTEDDE
jgi:hypothetical protein